MVKQTKIFKKKPVRWSRQHYASVFLYGMILLYTISSAYLYYRQTQWKQGSVFESDLPAHIKMVIVDGWYYSLTALVYRFLYLFPGRSILIAVFLAACTAAAVLLTAYGFYTLLPQSKHKNERAEKNLSLAAGLILNLVMPCYIRGLTDGRYIGMESASVWHNSTYIVMKWLGVICLLLYAGMERKIHLDLRRKDWIIFTLTLAVTTGVKPSFLMVFAPMMLAGLLWDLAIRKIPFSRLFLFGCAVLPSLLVIGLQNAVLFGTQTGNGWTLSPGKALSQHSGHPLVAAALSILFPLIVLLKNPGALKRDRWFGSTWVMTLIGFLEVYLFCETGKRAGDGNFMWGYSFAILAVFLVSLIKWLENIRAMQKNQSAERVYLCISGAALLYHLYCGIYFYILLLQGVSYWMWG